jgi:hypothetical protein
MSRTIVRSRRGIAFTRKSVTELEQYLENAKENECVLVLGGVFNPQGQPDLGFGIDLTPQPVAIPDQLGDVLFYWLADQPMLDRLRENWCVDAEWGRKTRVIPLPKDGGST